MDVGLRNLDITLGMSDRALMDFSDVALGRCPLSRAAGVPSRSARPVSAHPPPCISPLRSIPGGFVPCLATARDPL